MSQPVKLSDDLVLDARLAGEVYERSIAGQVEFWAKLGRSVEFMLEGRQVLAVRRNAGTQPLSQALAVAGTPSGRKQLAAYLSTQPYPHFSQHPTRAGMLMRTDEDGTETVGRFVNRVFIAAESKRSGAKAKRGIEAGMKVRRQSADAKGKSVRQSRKKRGPELAA